ncbi:hypothetical protein CKM354_000806700 [Cercospora kikuchii]|uniref:Uncharacterized protein n=1 Tax=Cercospora kikuchii TaxID=84275 RepID=A0A9P3FEY3_9PEZI|nr:uncharacterized protein CKM354_000806700 [Cercospora kikuchii]GIZ44881.1 hypothetical protein CKM354_000806700 [Cercospora kikuchii]
MDFLKRKLSVRKRSNTASSTQSSTITSTDYENRNLSPTEQRIEQLNDERYENEFRRSQDGTHVPSPTRSKSFRNRTPRKSSLTRSPASFVKYGGPGLNAPGNIKNDSEGNAFGISAGEVPPLPLNAHVHGDGQISDFERYRLQTLSRDPVHEGTGSERRGAGLEGVVEVEGR